MEPAGIVMPFAGSTAPQGYLLCDGSAVSRTDYADLFAAIGTTYGAGDESTTFNLPDLSGRVVLGVSQSHALGTTGGEATHTLTEQELPAHTHVVPAHGHANDITATTPALSHTITQPMFRYNSPNWGHAYHGSGFLSANVSSGTTTATASKTADAKVSAHDGATCTVTGGISSHVAEPLSNSGNGTPHNNIQQSLAMSYIISTGV